MVLFSKKTVSTIAMSLFVTLCFATKTATFDGYSSIQIKQSNVQGMPKGSSIQATIDCHYLTVVFLENLGQVNIVITDANDHEIRVESTPTPTGVNIYISNTGSYVVTFTLPNGDEYYGEFEVTD